MKERRSDTRKKTSALVYYNVEGKDGGLSEEGMAKAVDLSEGGAHLEFGRVLKEGEDVNLTVSVGEEMVDLKGKTVWSREAAAGVKMENPPGNYAALIQKLPD